MQRHSIIGAIRKAVLRHQEKRNKRLQHLKHLNCQIRSGKTYSGEPISEELLEEQRELSKALGIDPSVAMETLR